ncbi:MAG: hypothetical protein ACRDZO_18275 [Egibacteraceae bacterium]
MAVRIPPYTAEVFSGALGYDLPTPLVPGPTCIGQMARRLPRKFRHGHAPDRALGQPRCERPWSHCFTVATTVDFNRSASSIGSPPAPRHDRPRT